MKILSLKQHGLAPIGERSTDAAGNPVQRFKANLIRVGSFSHPTDGWRLDVNPQRLREWRDAAMRKLANDVAIPFTSKHFTDDANDTLGYVDSVAIEGDWLTAEGTFVGEDAILAASRNFVSVDLDDIGDGVGNDYGIVIQSVALTPRPVVNGQQRIAASANGAQREATVYVLDQRVSAKGQADDWVGRAIALANGAADDNWEDRTARFLAMDNDVSPATQRIIDRATQDVEQLELRLKRHTVVDFEVAADALGMETGTKLLDSLESEDALVFKLVQRIKHLEAQAVAQANIMDAKDKPARREGGASDTKSLSIERWVDDRADFHDLTSAQSKQLRDEMRKRAKAMSITTQDRAQADDAWVDDLITKQNAGVAGAV